MTHIWTHAQEGCADFCICLFILVLLTASIRVIIRK